MWRAARTGELCRHRTASSLGRGNHWLEQVLLAMMAEPCVGASVLSQPSLPMPFGSTRAAGIDAYLAEIACAKKRFADENLSMIGLRFKCDKTVRKSRFETYRHAFGKKFEAIKLDPRDALP